MEACPTVDLTRRVNHHRGVATTAGGPGAGSLLLELLVAYLAVGAALSFALGIALVVQKREAWLRWWRLRRGGLAPRHPLVLLHGLAGFDEVTVGPGGRRAYFRGLEPLVERHGLRVHRPRVPALGSVPERAAALVVELARLADTTGARRFNVIAHSMGGLDVRYALAHLGAARYVASVVTIGTPHRGTPIADLGAAVLGRFGLEAMLKKLGIPLACVEDLTQARMVALNASTPDVPGVFYGSVVVRADPGRIHPLLLPTHRLLARREDNDGLVPTESQAWGRVVLHAEGDHWGEIGWSGHGDVEAVFAAVLTELKGRGL